MQDPCISSTFKKKRSSLQEDTMPRQAMPLVTLRIISGLSRWGEQTSKDSALLLRLQPSPILIFFDGLENNLEILQAQAFPQDRENPAFDLLLHATTAKKAYLVNERT